MKIVMHHGIDGRNIERVMQKDKAFAQQTAQYPSKYKRKKHFLPCNLYRRLVKVEKQCIYFKQNNEGDESETHFTRHINGFHFREQRCPFKNIKKGNQLREVDKDCHGDGHHNYK